MVEVKYKSFFEMPFLFMTIFSLLGFVVVPILGMLKALWEVFNVGMDIESIKLFVLCAIILVAFGIAVALFKPNVKWIFDDIGITMKCSVKLFSKTLFDKVECFRWEEIVRLDFYPIGVFAFYKLGNRWLREVSLSYFHTNKKEALEFAVPKLPYYKISDVARQKLQKKYGIVVKEYSANDGSNRNAEAHLNH